MRSFDEQNEAILKHWPGWELIGYEHEVAEWRGPIRPNKRTYEVQVRYRVPHALLIYDAMRFQPRVQVLRPSLEMHHDYEQGPLPHVYYVGEPIDRVELCLFDVEYGEWTPQDLIAETTLNWASLWLNFYEGWLATKKWHGGGKHPEITDGDDGKRIAA